MTIKKEDSQRIKNLKHKARRKSIKEGMFATVKSSFFDNYISPFAIAINSSNSLVAMISSVSGLIGPIAQLFSSRLIEKYLRKKIVVKAVFLETLMILPMIIIAILFQKNIITNSLPLLLFLFYSFYIIFANISGPAWFSWMGDIVDDNFRGRWFAKRNLILGFLSVILTVSASFFLDFFKDKNLTMLGFAILFALAFIGRMFSCRIFKQQYEPKIKIQDGYYFSFTQFLFKAPTNNFGRFTLFRGCLSFADAILGSLLSIYLLRNLGLNYSSYMIIIFAGTIFSLLVINLWGIFADHYGNYKTILITSLFIPLLPILWILNNSIAYLIFVPSLAGGIVWAGFNLASGNFVYDNVTPQKRGIVISYYNVVVGGGIFLGAALGALLIKVITISTINPIVIIFSISAIFRLAVVLFWLPKFKETRPTPKFSGTSALKNIILKESKPAFIEGIHDITAIKDYLIE